MEMHLQPTTQDNVPIAITQVDGRERHLTITGLLTVYHAILAMPLPVTTQGNVPIATTPTDGRGQFLTTMA